MMEGWEGGKGRWWRGRRCGGEGRGRGGGREGGGWGGEGGVTVIVSENEDEDGLQPEEIEEVPGERGDPSDVEVAGCDAGLEHGFEADCEWEW